MASFGGRFKEFFGVGAFRFRYLHMDAAGGERVAVNAQRGEFVDDEGMEFRGFEP